MDFVMYIQIHHWISDALLISHFNNNNNNHSDADYEGKNHFTFYIASVIIRINYNLHFYSKRRLQAPAGTVFTHCCSAV